jgi:hypothetical protein
LGGAKKEFYGLGGKFWKFFFILVTDGHGCGELKKVGWMCVGHVGGAWESTKKNF